MDVCVCQCFKIIIGVMLPKYLLRDRNNVAEHESPMRDKMALTCRISSNEIVTDAHKFQQEWVSTD